MKQQEIYLIMKRSDSYVILGTGESNQFNNLKPSITLENSVEIPLNSSLPCSFFNAEKIRHFYEEHEEHLNSSPREIKKSDLIYQFVLPLNSH